MPHPLDAIPEIARLGVGQGLIRLPYGQDVPFTPRVRALVDTAAFQRLRQVSQLGLATAVYPGATHSRFEHALGVFHNALQYLHQLGRDARFVETIDTHGAEVLLCAALLHDVGHWPFCHPIEDMELPALPTHEAFAREILTEDAELSSALRTEWSVEAAEIIDVLDGVTDSPALRLTRSILSGPIDIDKLDYLDRDSLHAGVPYGRNFDKNRLISSLVLNAAGDGLAISAKGKTAAELMVFARYVMFSEVYWHHAVRSATAMFGRAFYELRDRLDLSKFLRGTEYEATNELRWHATGTEWQPLVEGVFGPTRRLYKQAAEWGPLNAPSLYASIARRPYVDLVRLSGKVASSLAERGIGDVTSADVLTDAPPPGREVEFRVDIFYPKERCYRSLDAVSPVTEALARRQFDDAVKRVRIFVHPRLRTAIDALPDLEGLVMRAVTELFEA
ncbi:MAG: HD domain-containing protein [Planctomycetota bacterium]|nr:HD domain-containing protein [Planctomycetaceae bacterium]MDQ3332712.1 HD domain-containing protein [Planctomycetota bacterium]